MRFARLLSLFALLALPWGGISTGNQLRAQESQAFTKFALNGADLNHQPVVMELSADGKSVVYYQGLPWPRLVVQGLKDDQPKVRLLSKMAPFTWRRPRISGDGKWVYFTANPYWKPRRPRALEAPQPWFPKVVRANWEGTPTEVIYPKTATSAGEFGVLLDLHPKSGRLLIGTGTQLTSTLVQQGTTQLKVQEIDPSTGVLKPLGFEVGFHEGIRYSGDGQSIYYTNKFSSQLFQLKLNQGTHAALSLNKAQIGRRLDFHELIPSWRSHLGSFSSGSTETYLLTRTQNTKGIVLQPKGSPDQWKGGPSVPLSLQKGILLSRSHFEDWPVGTLSSWAAPSLKSEKVFLSSGWVTKELNARSYLSVVSQFSPDVQMWKERLVASFPPRKVGEKLTHLRALIKIKNYIPERPDVEVSFTVLETAKGFGRIEISTPAINPADVPALETWDYSEKKLEFTSDEGTRSPRRIDEYHALLSLVSPYRLFVDPAGLNDSLQFSKGPTNESLSFQYKNGFHGEITFQNHEGSWVPLKIQSPKWFKSKASLKGKTQAQQLQTVQFLKYEKQNGRWTPVSLQLNDGGRVLGLSLEVLEWK